MTAETTTKTQTATIYRMVMPEHTCPYGIKTLDLLERHGFDVEDVHLETDEEDDGVPARSGVETTPQTFVDGELVGTLDDVRAFVGERRAGRRRHQLPARPDALRDHVPDGGRRRLRRRGSWISVRTFEWFIAFSMCGLGYLKLRDVESFSTMFLNYDLLARRWVPYSYIYPYAETGAGLLMIAAVLTWLSVPVALFIGYHRCRLGDQGGLHRQARAANARASAARATSPSASCRSPRTSPWSPWPSGWAPNASCSREKPGRIASERRGPDVWFETGTGSP